MRRNLVFAALVLTGCMAEPRLDGGAKADSGTNDAAAFDPDAPATACSVATAVFAPHCTGCHGPMGRAPDLSFAAMPELVNSDAVVVGDAEASLVYRKLAGIQAADEGGIMPPGGQLDSDKVNLVRRWIDEGASLDCETPIDLPEPERYHPSGFAQSELHGPELKFGPLDCRDCHGQDLTGGIAPSCDSCHEMGWRTNCTFCHGGSDNQSGAPPRDLDGQTLTAMLSFRAHTAHVTNVRHPAYDCTSCHTKPEDVLSLNHIFDATRGTAEVSFAAGLSANGQYAGNGQCGNLYCHGNGQSPGAYNHGSPTPTCSGCHAGPSAGRDLWETMSGEHEDHLREGIQCTDCHGLTVGPAQNILDPERHVNGVVDLQFSEPQLNRTQAGCNGTCHGQEHSSETW